MTLQTKPSGLSWATSIPRHWDSAKVCLVARLESGHTPSRQHPEYWVPEECTIPWFSLADVWQLREANQKYLGDTEEKISPLGVANSAARVLPAGTVVLSRTASVGFSGIMPRPMATTQDFANWVCGPRLLPEYLLWAFRAMKPEFARMMMGSTHQTIYMPDIRRLAIPVPPLAEQRTIADLLDRKTAAIDALIEKRESQILLIEEKRRALITTAITRGLSQDRGLPAQSPAAWNQCRLKHLVSFTTSGSRGWAEYYADSGAVFFRIGNLKRGRITLDMSDVQRVAPPQGAEGQRTRVMNGDVLLSITAFIGSIAVVTGLGEEAYVSQHVALVRPIPEQADPVWLGYALLSEVGQSQLQQAMYGGTKVQLGLEDVRELRLSVPPLTEQVAIGTWLRMQDESLDQLKDRISREIEKLSEYRQALITAAVTGQLDVVAQEAA